MKNPPEFYVNQALNLGAEHAVRFGITDVVFDARALLKCMFGCAEWGRGHTCPSRAGALKPWEYKEILERYTWGIIIHAHDKKTTQNVSFAIESKAFTDGYYFALAFNDCGLCNECAGNIGQPCRNPKRARPAFHSVGIDVFATAREFGLPIETLSSPDEQQNWYSAVFIE
ncbi:metal-binding protein [Bacteroidia bacterium]|nr:metal-binding protein [Bacteroidia bacterium]GHT82598.1 metal-binding protein [Bacteroidia bacterium]